MGISQVKNAEVRSALYTGKHVLEGAAGGAAYGGAIGFAVTLGNPVGALGGALVGAVGGILVGLFNRDLAFATGQEK